MTKYVIVGNGVAAAACVEGIRSEDKDGRIVIISAENHPVYCRPLISYYLEGKTDVEKMNYRQENFYEEMKAEVIYGSKAVRIDKECRTVLLDDGREVDYDVLCMAAGSSPFVPPFAGLDRVSKKFSFMTIDDAMSLKENIDENSSVLIMGAGLIGLKCAEGIAESAGSITVCDLAPRVLPSILDETCAGIMQAEIEKKGIKLILGDTVEKFSANRAVMKSGKVVDFDLLVLAVGVRPNIGLLAELGGEIGKGIAVDYEMRTNIDGIFAAGDCTEGTDLSSGERKVMALMPNAYMQGYTAGVNMAGGKRSLRDAIPMNSLGLFGYHAMTAGTYDGEMLEEKTEEGLKRFFVKDNKLKGFIILGETERAGIYTSLIREETPLDEIDFELLRGTATTAGFSIEKIEEKFGKEV